MQTGLPCCLTVPFRGALLHRMRLGVRCRRRRLERSRKDDAVALNSLLGLHVGRVRDATRVIVLRCNSNSLSVIYSSICLTKSAKFT